MRSTTFMPREKNLVSLSFVAHARKESSAVNAAMHAASTPQNGSENVGSGA